MVLGEVTVVTTIVATAMKMEAETTIFLNVPEPHGECVQLNCFVDADQAENEISQSHKGILLFVCNAPNIQYSKQQNIAETFTFGSVYIAANTATEMIKSFLY